MFGLLGELWQWEVEASKIKTQRISENPISVPLAKAKTAKNARIWQKNNEQKTFWEEHNVCACTLTSPSACDTLARVGGVLGEIKLKVSTSQSRQFLKSLPAIDAIGTAEITWTSGCDGKGLTCATV